MDKVAKLKVQPLVIPPPFSTTSTHMWLCVAMWQGYILKELELKALDQKPLHVCAEWFSLPILKVRITFGSESDFVGACSCCLKRE